MDTQVEAFLSSAVRSTPDAIIGCDVRGRITAWNAAAERMYGYRSDEVRHQPVRMLYPPEIAERDWAVFQKILQGRHVVDMPTTRLRKDGSRVPVRMTFSPVEGVDGSVRGVVSVAHELTDEIRSEARLAALLEAVPDSITGIDRDGRIVLANEGAERITGYPRDQLVGLPYTVLLPEEERGRIAGIVDEVFADPRPRTVAYTDMIRADGARVPTENTVTCFDTGNGTILLVVCRDITERVRAEKERADLRAQRLEALGQLAGGVAHDFNNLLAIIGNYADLLSEEVTGPALDDLDRIRQAAQRGAALTQQLLTFSRRDLNRPELLEPAAALGRLLPLLRTAVGQNHEVRLEAPPRLCPVLLDPGQLEQILVNLVVNARDAMPDGGRVRVTADDFRPRVPDPAYQPAPELGRRYLRLRVHDTGVGMSAEVAARAFEPFFTTKAKHAGAGLGLAAVHGIVGQAGGCLAVESHPGDGTTMTVLLPAAGEASPAEPGGPVAAPEDGGLAPGAVVLLVDDEEGVRESTARVLTRHGYRVLTAHDGPSALAVAQEHRDGIDLLLTDVIMPRMHGGELAQRVADLIPGIRVIFMSGYAEPLLDTTPEAATPMLEKPFTTTELLRTLRSGQPVR